MKSILLTSAAAFALLFSTTASFADCGIEKGSVRILGNEFPAIQTVAKGAKECATEKVTVTSNLNKEHKDIQVAALKANPAEYTAALVANGSIVPLMNDGLIRPLDDLVEKYGQSLGKNQLITVDGKVMAVAFMANAQHLMYRKDLLEKAGIEPPKTYEEVLEAAKKLKESGVQYPLTGTYKAGWNLAEEFVNMYLGMGGEFFEAGSAKPAIANEQGVKALETMKALSEYMNPDFLTYDSNAAAGEYEAGNAAIMNMWGSRAGPIVDDEGSTEEVTSNTVMAAAPTVGGGAAPATTLWWDGFTIAKNISDEDAAATFQALVNGVSPKQITPETNDQAVWLIEGYKPGPTAQGVADSGKGGAKPYPMVPYMGALHTALGAELADFMQGSETAEQALKDVEAAYTNAAKEAGFIQ